MTIEDALETIRREQGQSVQFMSASRFPKDVLVVMTSQVSDPGRSLSQRRLRQIRLTTFVGRTPVTGIIVRTEWLLAEEE